MLINSLLVLLRAGECPLQGIETFATKVAALRYGTNNRDFPEITSWYSWGWGAGTNAGLWGSGVFARGLP